jgi:hypothetical protein
MGVTDDSPRPSQMVPLDAPRPLTDFERDVLEFMLDHPDAPSELRTQAEGARVISTCDCGCRSIGILPRDGSPPTPGEGPGYVQALGKSAAGRDVEVILQFPWRTMVELEIWDGMLGGGSRGDVPVLSTLRHR